MNIVVTQKFAPGSVFFGRNVPTDAEEQERVDKAALIAKLKERLMVKEKIMEEMTKNIKTRHFKLKTIRKLRLLDLGNWRRMNQQSRCIQGEIVSLEDTV